MNNGKRFEQDFKKSVPKSVYYYRFRDGTSAWDKSESTRFQMDNICDCFLFERGALYLLELKSNNGKSIPYAQILKGKKKPFKQIDEMISASQFGINAGFVIKLNGETYYIDVESVDQFIKTSDRKSIPLKFLQDNGIFIPRVKLKVNYKYDIGVML